jgi:hypothetical protein
MSSGRLQRLATIELAARAHWSAQGEAVSIVPADKADPVIWTARLKTGRVVIFRANASKAFRAAALIASPVAEHSAVIAVLADLAVIALVAAADLGAVALADSVVVVAAGSEADVENNA